MNQAILHTLYHIKLWCTGTELPWIHRELFARLTLSSPRYSPSRPTWSKTSFILSLWSYKNKAITFWDYRDENESTPHPQENSEKEKEVFKFIPIVMLLHYSFTQSPLMFLLEDTVTHLYIFTDLLLPLSLFILPSLLQVLLEFLFGIWFTCTVNFIVRNVKSYLNKNMKTARNGHNKKDLFVTSRTW